MPDISKVVSQVLLEHSLMMHLVEGTGCPLNDTDVVTQKSVVNDLTSHGMHRISAGPGISALHGFDRSLASRIDHTLLKPEATREQVLQLCEEARTYEFASVCVHPSFVALCADQLRGTPVRVCTVIGFPLGAHCTHTKVQESETALRDGARELDMVIHVGMLKSRDFEYVRNDIRAVVRTAHGFDRAVLVKTIIETCLLTDEEKVLACLIAKEAGADFVKTSTGFGKGGATVGDILLMRRVVGTTVGVKASGGIRTTEDARAMAGHGADRIGASASVQIVQS